MISATVMTGLLDALRTAGADPEEFIRQVGLDNTVLHNADGFLPCSAYGRALEEAARLTSDACFGLHFGERSNPKKIGPLAYAVLNSPTIAAAFETAGRYLHVHNEAAQVAFSVEGELAYLRYTLANLDLKEPRQFNEYSMAVGLNTLRIMAGSHWTPREVHFAHKKPEQTAEHARIFKSPVLFNCTDNALVMESEFCHQPVPAADPNLFRIMRRYLDDVLSRAPREDELLASIRKTIAEVMRDGSPDIARVAKRSALSPRTLQRRLRNCGVEFKALVDDTRRRFALEYLKDSENTLTEIAFLLGYSEVSAFSRAFKRWTGITPLDHRRKSAA
ncbi:MAG TPA: AraC family transcriptional regulator [Candidatus Binatia bacterium]